MSDPHQPSLEPAHVTMKVGCAYTGDSRSRMYAAIGRGEVLAFKQGKRTLLDFGSLKKRVAAREPAHIGGTIKATSAEYFAALRLRTRKNLGTKKQRKRRGA